MPLSLDPAVFRPEAISPDTAEFNAKIVEAFKGLPPSYMQEPAAIREARERGEGIFGALQLLDVAQERSVSAGGVEVPVRVFVPDRVEGVYLHYHGGGWVLGRAHHQDVRLWATATNCNLAVVSIDYRLAPEHPYPAGPDDCEAAARWLVERSKSEFGTDRLVIGGESAGAHLAAVTAVRMRDRHAYQGFLAANLVYGVYDLAMTPSCANWGERELILSTPTMAWFIGHFVADAARRREPDVSPLYADLRGLPPALFTVGTLDPLLDDTLFMAARWAGAGNETELAVYPGGLHGVTAFPTALGATANARIDAFLQGAVKG